MQESLFVLRFCCAVRGRIRPARRTRSRRRNATPAGQPPAGGRGGGGRGGRGGIAGDDADDDARGPTAGQIPAKYTQAGDQVSPPLAWSNVPDNTASVRADRARRRRSDWQRHRRHPALDAVEHSGSDAKSGRGRAAEHTARRRHAADQRQRSVLSRSRRPGRVVRRITTCSSCTRSTRRSTCPRSARRRRRRAPPWWPRWPDTSAARRSTSDCSNAPPPRIVSEK